MKTRITQELETVLNQFGNKYFTDNQVNKARVIDALDRYDF